MSETKRLRRVEALEELREVLNLESLPIRIECFDISNIQGQEIVGSMVVFEDGLAQEGALPQVRGARAGGPGRLRRDGRGRRRAASRGSRPGTTPTTTTSSFAATPNLVVIDGGKGQLSAALEAMEAYDLPRVAVVSLAKRVEEVFLPGRPDPVLLPDHSPGLQLIQRLRDEAHRFAITFHRAAPRRERPRVDVRPARRRRARCGAARCSATSARRSACWPRAPRSSKACPGVPAKTARHIYAQLHKAGRA